MSASIRVAGAADQPPCTRGPPAACQLVRDVGRGLFAGKCPPQPVPVLPPVEVTKAYCQGRRLVNALLAVTATPAANSKGPIHLVGDRAVGVAARGTRLQVDLDGETQSAGDSGKSPPIRTRGNLPWTCFMTP
jgi:hypothetical protein